MSEPADIFIEKATNYCAARREFLDLKKRLRGKGCNGEREGHGWLLPCWHWDSEVFEDEDDWCDDCRPYFADFHRRGELAGKFAALAREMLRAFDEMRGGNS